MKLRRSIAATTLVALAISASLSVAQLAARGNIAANESPSGTKSTSEARPATASQDDRAPDLWSAKSGAPNDVDDGDCNHLAGDYALRTKLNGKRLPLEYERLEKGLGKTLLTDSKVIPLADGHLLAGLGDTLYMFDARQHVQWKYKPSWILWDFAFVESTGLVYGAAGDGIMFILDGSTGKKLYSHFQNGKANHLQVVPFGADMCLITNSLAGYREALGEWAFGKTEMIEPDEITVWRGTKALWSLDFSPDAELVVKGDRILAVTKTDRSIYVREIIPPKTDDK